MGSDEETEEEVLNEHNPAPPTERIWMPVYQDEDKKLAKHDWCLDTGIIKNLSGEEAKPKGFYVSVLNKMKYICAQPAIKYFAWQIDVFIHSLLKQGINQKDIHIISGIQHSGIDEYFSILQKKYPNILFRFYNDTRSYYMYQPSIKPHLIYKHYLEYSFFFYH